MNKFIFYDLEKYFEAASATIQKNSQAHFSIKISNTSFSSMTTTTLNSIHYIRF